MAKIVSEAKAPALVLHPNEFYRLKRYFTDADTAAMRLYRTNQGAFGLARGGDHRFATLPDFSVRLPISGSDIILEDAHDIDCTLTQSQGAVLLQPIRQREAAPELLEPMPAAPGVPVTQMQAQPSHHRAKRRERAFGIQAAPVKPVVSEAWRAYCTQLDQRRRKAERLLAHLKAERRQRDDAQLDQQISQIRGAIIATSTRLGEARRLLREARKTAD